MFSPQIDKYRFRAGLNLHKLKLKGVLHPVTMGICPKNPFDHVSLSEEEARDVKKELDDIDNKFDEARAAKLKCSQ